jgi:hypothetical protein
MDPLSALSLAGTVVQFLSFSREIVHIGKETYRSASGSTQDVMEISMVIDNLSELHDSVKELWDRETGALETRRPDLQWQSLSTIAQQSTRSYQTHLRSVERQDPRKD